MRIGRWTLLERLARGGMGETWRATSDDGELGVVKRVRPGLSGAPLRERFELERRALERLNSGALDVSRLLDFGEHDGVPFLVTQWIDGTPIERFLAEHSASIDARCDYAVRCAALVGAVHALGVIHADIKPANLLVDRGGVPHLIDFGLAQFADEAPRLGDDARLMSPRYAAPEQFRGHPLSFAADVFALAMTLHELLAGAHAFSSTATYLELESSCLQGRSLPTTPCGAHIDALLACAHALDPSRRFRDASAFASALRAALGG